MITTKKIGPRPYQQKAAAAIHREWDAGNKKTLVVMPTGTGKTIVFASIVNDQVAKGEHVLILAHREELLQQASDKLKMVTGLETALEKAQSSALNSDKMVVVASVQTLSKQNRLMKYPRDYFGTIIIDEAHHTAAKTYKGILEHFSDAKVLGVTATPAVPPPFVPTAPAKSHEYYCCLARWDGSYIGYEIYKSEQAAQNARKQIARRGETAVYATVEEAEAWVDKQKAARTRR